MGYCTHCGKELNDEAVVCTECGCATEKWKDVFQRKETSSALSTVAKVFMIISTVVMGIYLIPLAWCLPMTIVYFQKIKHGKPVGTGFKVCTLLFVNTISGILMLCDNN